MSIINDALKKTQNNLLSKKDKNIIKPGITPPTDSSVNQRNAKPKKNTLKIIIILLLLLIALFMITILILILNKSSDKRIITDDKKNTLIIAETPPLPTKSLRESTLSIQAPQERKEQTAIPPTITVATKGSDKPLTLDGIMTIENKTIALINGDDYQVGDKIWGMEIILISSKHVEIKTLDGKIIILSVKGK